MRPLDIRAEVEKVALRAVELAGPLEWADDRGELEGARAVVQVLDLRAKEHAGKEAVSPLVSGVVEESAARLGRARRGTTTITWPISSSSIPVCSSLRPPLVLISTEPTIDSPGANT